LAGLAALAVGLGFSANPAQAIDLDQACARFASKLNAAVQCVDSAKAQKVYQVGSQRIASRFNGATCPNVQPPAAAPSN
jgi:3-oxoacyl-[acyl-carrier-protein] synthase III